MDPLNKNDMVVVVVVDLSTQETAGVKPKHPDVQTR